MCSLLKFNLFFKKLKASRIDETKFTSYTAHNDLQNDVPNQFWKFVSTYCSPIKNEYLKVSHLNLIKNYFKIDHYFLSF